MAMSGGVDSSVAAAILKRDGFDVVGCFMRLGSPGDSLESGTPSQTEKTVPLRQIKIGHQGCCSISDAADAREVAAVLGIPLYVLNFRNDFGRIIDYFVDEYVAGRTPNPCVRCNDWLKFGKLHEYAKQLQADFVASGHYARVEQVSAGVLADASGGSPALFRGVDSGKDQSYVLFGVPRAQLSHMMFPIGAMPKSQVRDLAKQFSLPVFDKPDSQEICFVPDNDYAGLVNRRRPEATKPGKIFDESGRELGEHEGQHHFTVGQRRGLDIPQGERVYVLRKDAASNSVIVGPKERLLSQGCTVSEANWLCDADDIVGREVMAKYRYNTPPAKAVVSLLPDFNGPTPSGRKGRFEVKFIEPQSAVAPGQAVVLYDGDRVLGGGWIE